MCRRAEPLAEAAAASPSWGSVQTPASRWSPAVAPGAARVTPGGAVSSEQPRHEEASVPPSRACSLCAAASGVLGSTQRRWPVTTEAGSCHPGPLRPPANPHPGVPGEQRGSPLPLPLPGTEKAPGDVWKVLCSVSVNACVLTGPRKDPDISDHWFIFD